MKSEKYSIANLPTSTQPKHAITAGSRMLTPLEVEQLRQDKKESSAYFQKAFAHLRPTPSSMTE
jgi:hypothetical protein